MRAAQHMKPVRRACAGLVSLLLAGLAVAPSGAAAAQKFELAGVEVTLPDDGWEVFDANTAAGNIGTGGVQGNIGASGKLLLRRSPEGRVLAALLMKGSLGTAQGIRFTDTSCPQVPTDVFYARRLAKHDSDPPECLLLGGPFDGQPSMENSLSELHAAQRVHPFDPPAVAWMVVAYSYNSHAAKFSVEGLVAAQGFEGLSAAAPLGALPQRMPPAVAAWGDAVGLAMRQALDGFFSRSTRLPPMLFSAAAAPR